MFGPSPAVQFESHLRHLFVFLCGRTFSLFHLKNASLDVKKDSCFSEKWYQQQIIKAALAQSLCRHAEYQSPTHPQCWVLASPTFPKPPPPSPRFWFSHQLWAGSVCLPLFSSQSQLFSVTRHPACHLLPLFPGKLREWVHGKGQRQGGLEGWFGIDKATSVSDTNMASEPTAVLCCAPLLFCLPQRDWASLCPGLLALSIHVCPLPALTLSELLFWLKQTVVWSALSCSKGREGLLSS